MQNISVQELNKLIGKANIIDIREDCERRLGFIPSSKNMPANGLYINREFLLDKNEKYYIVCHSGGRSYSITNYLSGLGYDVVNVTGGTYAYSKLFELDR